MVQTARWLARYPCAANIDDQRAVIGQHSVESFSKRAKPLNILICIDIPIFLLAHQSERWTRHNEIDRARTHEILIVKQLERISAKYSSFRGCKGYPGHRKLNFRRRINCLTLDIRKILFSIDMFCYWLILLAHLLPLFS